MKAKTAKKTKKTAAARKRPAKAVAPSGTDRASRLLQALEKHYPAAHCALDHSNPLELLVATILSAQCTDKRVNIVTRSLFAKYTSAQDYARVPREELEAAVRTTGFFRNKAKSIQGTAERLVAHHHGRVPDTMEDLLKLPGVARKTANVVLGNAYGKNEGVVVDTHVARLAGRLGLSRHKDPVKIEKDLMVLFPRPSWTYLSHALIHHGRLVCVARKPRCESCFLAAICPSAESAR